MRKGTIKNKMETHTSTTRKSKPKKASQFLKNSSVHAVSRIGHSKSASRKIFWLLVLVFSLLGCTYEIYRWLNVYFQYPVLVSLEIENPLKTEFPAVTVCNLNRVQSKHEACVKEGLDFYRCPLFEPMLRTLFVSERRKIIKDPESESERKLKEESTLFLESYSNLDEFSRDVYGYRYKDLIQHCSFDYTTCGFDNFTYLNDLQFGNCFTFNRRNSFNDRHLTSNHAGPENGLELEINPKEDTYLDITPNVGFLVVIHEADEDPKIVADGINISPGFEAHLAVTKTSIKRLPPPYRDQCYNYNRSATDPKVRSEYDCILMCMQESSIASCSCADPLLATQEYMVKCDLRNTSEMSCLNGVMDELSDSGLPCHCPLPCWKTSYNIQISSTPRPTLKQEEFFMKYDFTFDEGFLYTVSVNETNSTFSTLNNPKFDDLVKTEVNMKKNSVFRERKSLLKVFFKNFEHKIYSQKPMYTESELYGHLGGHLSFWLGLSLVAIFECIQNATFLIKFFPHKCSRRL